MKKNRLIAIICIFVLVLSLFSCGKNPGQSGENNDVTTTPTYETKLLSSWQNYAIVYPDEASVTVSNAFTELRNVIKEKYGVSLPIKSDFKLPYEELPVGTLEILIGETNRPESIAAREVIKSNDYTVEFVNNRLVIVGGSEEATAEAIAHVIDYLLKDDGFNVPANDKFSVPGKYNIGTLTINGVHVKEFQLVRGSGMNAAERLMMSQLREVIANVSGYKLNLAMPSDAETEYEILIGNTGRAETSSEVNVGEYAINQTDKKLALYGNGENSSAFVLKYLIDFLNSIPECESYDLKLENVSGLEFTLPTLTATNLPTNPTNYANEKLYDTDFTKIENVLAKFNVSVNELPDEVTVLDPIDVNDYPLSLKKQIYVSPDGDDQNSGTIDKPLATIAAAVRKMTNSGGGVIWLRGGDYSVTKSISIANQHSGTMISPLFIMAYGDETPVISTAKKLNPADFSSVNYANDPVASKIDSSAQPHIAYVNLFELGWTEEELGEITTKTKPRIYVNGEETHIARYPNADEEPLYFDFVFDTGSVTSASASNLYNKWIERVASGEFDDRKAEIYTDSNGNKNIDHGWSIRMIDLTPCLWENTGEIYYYGNVFEGWEYVTCQIKSFDVLTKKMTSVNGTNLGAKHSTNSPSGHNTYYLYNAIEALDCEGEWFLDYNTGNLYMYAGADFLNSEILFSASSINVIDVNNASNIVIDGITIASSFMAGIEAYESDQIVIQNCTITNTKGHGIHFKNSTNSAAIYNDLSATGSAMIRVSGSNGKQYQLDPWRNIIQNNYIHDPIKDNQGGISISGNVNVVSHNYLEYTQIGMTEACECIIEYNELKGGSKDTSDAGLIYGSGFYNFGNHIRYNYMHDWANAGKAIYFDDLACRNYAYYNLADTTGGEYHTVNMMYSSSGHYNVFVGNVCVGRSTDYAGESCLYFDNNTSLGYRWETHSNGFVTTFATKYNLSNLYKRFPEFEQYINMMNQHVEERAKSGYVRNELEIYLRSPAHNVYMNNLLLGLTDIRIPLTKETNSVTGEKMESLTLVKDNFASKNIELFMPGYLDNDYTVDPAALDEIKEVIPSFYMPEYERAGITYER